MEEKRKEVIVEYIGRESIRCGKSIPVMSCLKYMIVEGFEFSPLRFVNDA